MGVARALVRSLVIATVLYAYGMANGSCARAQQPPAAAKPAQPPAAAQPEPAKPDVPRPVWLVQCDGSGAALECRTSQTILLQQTGQLLISAVVRKPPKGEGPALMLHLPHGLFLPAGATLQVDTAKPVQIAIQTCDQKGCYAGVPLAKELLAGMQKAEKLIVTFQDLQKQTITVPMPLAGFTDAFQKMP